MSATWDKSTGRVTFEDGRFIVLTGEDAERFGFEWNNVSGDRQAMLQDLIRSKRAIHYPPKR